MSSDSLTTLKPPTDFQLQFAVSMKAKLMLSWFYVIITGRFRDESFQAFDYTGTDNQKQRNKTLHRPETQKTNKKHALANKTN